MVMKMKFWGGGGPTWVGLLSEEQQLDPACRPDNSGTFSISVSC